MHGTFLRRSILTATIGAASYSRISGANDRVNVAVVGLGGRGRALLGEWARVPGARLAALCDVDQAALERAMALAEKASGEKPRGYSDMRQLFAAKDIDAVTLPLPNHWHALATIWACQAGKDVYVEKPASHSFAEGREMIAATAKYRRVVQVGLQSRSTPHKIRAIELVRQGAIGKVYPAAAICFKRRPSIGRKPDGPAPPGVDWDLFLGPAPMRPFNENRFRYNWHWFWDTGNGDIGNQGVHELDMARWGLGAGANPRDVVSTGGKYVYDDDQETPNTQLSSYHYGTAEIVSDVRGIVSDGPGALEPDGRNYIGVLFYGSDGYLAVNDNGFQLYKGEAREKAAEMRMEKTFSPSRAHLENFLDAVRSRNPRTLNAGIEDGVASADLCHLANISYRIGRRLQWNDGSGKFDRSPDADALLGRKRRPPYTVGVV